MCKLFVLGVGAVLLRPSLYKSPYDLERFFGGKKREKGRKREREK